MKQFDPIAALAIPDGALVDRRVPKTLLIENGCTHGGRQAAHPGRCRRDPVAGRTETHDGRGG